MKDYEKLREEKARCEARLREINEELRDEPVRIHIGADVSKILHTDSPMIVAQISDDKRSLSVIWPYEARVGLNGDRYSVTFHQTRS